MFGGEIKGKSSFTPTKKRVGEKKVLVMQRRGGKIIFVVVLTLVLEEEGYCLYHTKGVCLKCSNHLEGGGVAKIVYPALRGAGTQDILNPQFSNFVASLLLN